MKRPKSFKKPVPDRYFPELTPERLKELKALAPDLNKQQLKQLYWEIKEMAEILLAIYSANQ